MQDNQILELWGPTGTWLGRLAIPSVPAENKENAGWLAVKRKCRVACAGFFNINHGKDDFGRMPTLLQHLTLST
jgi:hypothetical protein